MLGLNEISWPNYNTSKAKYHTMIDQIRASQADVQIYLQAVMPIGKYAETHHSYLRMAKIQKYTEMLKTVAVDKKVYYIDPASALFFAAIFLGDVLSPVQIIGALMILGGAAIGELAGNRASRT